MTTSSGKRKGVLSSGRVEVERNTFLSALAGVVLSARKRWKEYEYLRKLRKYWNLGTLYGWHLQNIAVPLGGKDCLGGRWTQGTPYSENYSSTIQRLNHFCKDAAALGRSWFKTWKQIGGCTSPICNRKRYKDATGPCAGLSGRV